MICSSVNLFFTSNLLFHGIGLQSQTLLKSGGTSRVPARGEGSGCLSNWLNRMKSLPQGSDFGQEQSAKVMLESRRSSSTSFTSVHRRLSGLLTMR